jgi:predicted enzyme related to lactoylglutathione lyase
MGQPVVHFEIIGKDPAKLRGYFGELFGWEFDLPSPVSAAVSDPASYGFVNRMTTSDGTGIPGGVGGGPASRQPWPRPRASAASA